jgi:uncharacterized membrane protein
MSHPSSHHPISHASGLFGHRLYPMSAAVPIVFFALTLLCDLMLMQGGSYRWFTASEFLQGAGILTALLAALGGMLHFARAPRLRTLTIAWMQFLGNSLAILLEGINWFRRYSFGPDTVGPMSLTATVFAILVLLMTGWLGWELVFRRRVAFVDGRAFPQR